MSNFTTLVNIDTNPPPPHVAICIPAPDMCHKDSRTCLRDLRDFAKQHFHISDVDANSSDVVSVRNLLLVGARKTGAQWYLFLDSDMIYAPDTLHRLFGRRKDIIGATYVRRAGNHATLGTMLDIAGIENIWQQNGAIQMRHMPFGCMLIKASVFDALDRPHFRHIYDIHADDNLPGTLMSEDHAFCERVREKGYEVWCDVDLSKQIGHIGQYVFTWDDRGK